MTQATLDMDALLQQMEASGVTVWDRYTIAKAAKCSVHHACYMIWDHQRSQRNKRPQNRPQMRFHRMLGYRTRSARYQTGDDIAALKGIAHSYADDIACKFSRATGKDIESVAASNPAAAAAFSMQLQLIDQQVRTAVATLLSV